MGNERYPEPLACSQQKGWHGLHLPFLTLVFDVARPILSTLFTTVAVTHQHHHHYLEIIDM